MSFIIDKIIQIVRVAGIEIMKIYNGIVPLYSYKKSDFSPVTSADLLSNRIIVNFLKILTPNIPIISEENVFFFRNHFDWYKFWLIDPLDGTKEFLSRNNEFTVNVALIEYGKPVLGVIYVPAYDLLYAADNGKAWKINSIGNRLNIVIKNKYPPIIVISRSHEYGNFQQLQDYLINFRNYKLIKVGSSFKFCLIADGNAQFYPRFSPIKIWDIAAGHAIAEAAGALVHDWSGFPLDYYYMLNNKSVLNSGFQVSLSF